MGEELELFQVANYAEAALWSAIGVTFAVLAVVRHRRWRRLFVMAAAAFVAFGGSDVVETQTGAWWRPWWLLAWKAACLGVLAALWLVYRRAAAGRRLRGADGES